jgi:recombination protein RecT
MSDQQLTAFRGTIDKLGSEFCKALPAHVPAAKFQRIVVSAVAANPALLGKDRTSLLASCMKAAADGLLLDGREAALVAYGSTVQYMPMIGGVLKKLRQSGELESITSEVVYEHDEFDRWIDEDGEHFKHRPSYGEDRGKAKLVYAFARTKDDGKYLEVMDVAAVEKVRAVSKAKDNGPWVQWWDEMARKTVTRRLAKRLPSSTDLDRLFEHDNENTDFAQTPERTTVRPERPMRLQQVVGTRSEPEPTNVGLPTPTVGADEPPPDVIEGEQPDGVF